MNTPAWALHEQECAIYLLGQDLACWEQNGVRQDRIKNIAWPPCTCLKLSLPRIHRLVLDAVILLGPDAPSRSIYCYVRQRRWLFSQASCIVPLLILERDGMITSRWNDDPVAAKLRGESRRRLYSVTK